MPSSKTRETILVPECIPFGGEMKLTVDANLKTTTVRLKKPVNEEEGLYGELKDHYGFLERGVPVRAEYAPEDATGEIVPIMVISGPIGAIPLPALLSDGFGSAEECADVLTSGYYGHKYGEITVDTEVETIIFLSKEGWDGLGEETRVALLEVEDPEELYDVRFADVWKESLAFWASGNIDRQMALALAHHGEAPGESIAARLSSGLDRAIRHCGLTEWEGVVDMYSSTDVASINEI